MIDRPTIERCFHVYLETQVTGGRKSINPVFEVMLQAAFYCGFDSALTVVDVVAERPGEPGRGTG